MEKLQRTEFIDLKLPNTEDMGRYLLWASGRIAFSAWLFALRTIRETAKLTVITCDLLELGTKSLLTVYTQLPYAGTPATNIIEASVTQAIEIEFEIITDLVSAIEDKQIMIIGEMGTGKSTIAQYLAYTVGGRVKVYEPEGTPDDWIGLDVVGKGENWEAIDHGMRADLDDLSSQMKIREVKGDAYLNGSERVIIVEEYPEMVDKVDSSGEWLERHARRGRKARRFCILLSQYDRVAAWGLEGKGDLANAFYRLRLGKTAVAHAKHLKNDVLINWLRSDRSHCLLDDVACKLPSYREMKAVIPRLGGVFNFSPVKTAETVAQQDFQVTQTTLITPPDEVLRLVKVAQDMGLSDTRIIKEILGYSGAQYGRGKEILSKIRS